LDSKSALESSAMNRLYKLVDTRFGIKRSEGLRFFNRGDRKLLLSTNFIGDSRSVFILYIKGDPTLILLMLLAIFMIDDYRCLICNNSFSVGSTSFARKR